LSAKYYLLVKKTKVGLVFSYFWPCDNFEFNFEKKVITFVQPMQKLLISLQKN